jgi:hypothetical protein
VRVQLPPQAFDPETVAMMGRVCDEAWNEARSRLAFPEAGDASGLREVVALRVMAAVAVGQRNPERLKAIALDALDA